MLLLLDHARDLQPRHDAGHAVVGTPVWDRVDVRSDRDRAAIGFARTPREVAGRV